MVLRSEIPSRGFIPLFWRLFIPNATVLATACVVLTVEPANGRVLVLAVGLIVMVTVNLFLMRRTIAPLARVMSLMDTIDPLEPGRRLPVVTSQSESEVTALTASFNRMLERLESERQASERAALMAQEEERQRVAAELHDDIGQQLTALVLDLDRLARQAPEQVGTQMQLVTEAAKSTLDDVRGIASQLRPEALDLGLVPALRNLCDRMESSSGLVIRRTLPLHLRALPVDVELVAYRVAQAALTNVVRHARAQTAYVVLREDDASLELSIADDGVGLSDGMMGAATGGLRGMRQRALSVGARLEIDSGDGRGTCVRLSLPLG